MDRNQISINFQEAVSCAETLEAYAADVENIARKNIDDSIYLIKSAWKGSNADAFTNKQVALASDVKDVAAEMKRIAADIRKTAKTIYDTEMRNLEIAEKREAEARAKELSNLKDIPGAAERIKGPTKDNPSAGMNPAIKKLKDLITKIK